MSLNAKLLQQWKDNDTSYMLIECRCGIWFSKEGSLPRHVSTCGHCGKTQSQKIHKIWNHHDNMYEARKQLNKEMRISTARRTVAMNMKNK